ncbi:unnamed protein product [Fraxinus pennsylvanica]|uniref:GH18 domain-containing protein n=1 Tax=Fraxinus pennsylvanica TaxID=56036 RepID=A0AAD1Z3K2_9LAMI|nr:unnamed protein product [Fraxinus pennsylvanica]
MASSSSSQAIKGGYWPSWAKNLPPSSIETSFFTHIYYAFLIPNNVTFKFDIEYTTAVALVNFTSTLRAKKPLVKILFSIGGAAEGPFFFGRMASSPSMRKNFIGSSIEVARKFGFDGIDLDWEYPQTPKDMENLAYLLDEWRLEVQLEAKTTKRPPLLLTAAVYFSANLFLSGPYRSYPATSITKNLDWINVMNYDYHGSWEPSITGAHSALFDSKTNISTSYGLGSWIKSGVPKSKLIMGLPLYGKTWLLKDSKSHGVGSPAIDVGPGDQGVLTFAEIEQFNRDHKAKVEYDLESVSMYSVAGTTWIGYDDTLSVTMKIAYARALGIRGYFFWAVDGDYKWKISKRASQLWCV